MKNKSFFYKSYIKRLVIRIVVLLFVIGLYMFYPQSFDVVKDYNFFIMFSPLHLVWLIWMFDMLLQLIHVPNYWPLGSQKFMKHRYMKPTSIIDKKELRKIMRELNKGSILVAIAWITLVAIIDMLYLLHIISFEIVVIISTFFYVCDVICIIGWCPFKTFFMHNKCCTTCRIYNWDHAMMFTPLIVIPGILTYSLLFMSLFVVIVWEVACAKHPERFIERANDALKCKNCKDKLCGREIGVSL